MVHLRVLKPFAIFLLQLLQNCDLPCVTFGVEKVPIGENSFVGVPHNYHSSSLECANVLLRKISTQITNIVRVLKMINTQ